MNIYRIKYVTYYEEEVYVCEVRADSGYEAELDFLKHNHDVMYIISIELVGDY